MCEVLIDEDMLVDFKMTIQELHILMEKIDLHEISTIHLHDKVSQKRLKDFNNFVDYTKAEVKLSAELKHVNEMSEVKILRNY